MLAVTVLLGWVSFLLTHTISFRFSELIPYKLCTTCRGCLDYGLCRWLGRSDLHGSHVKMLPVGILFPVAERDASYLHPHLPLSLPEDVKCERNNIMWKKNPVCTVLSISSCGWGFERTLVEASIYEAHCSFLSVLHKLLVLALLDVAPPPVLLSEQTSTSCPECEDVHSSATPFAIVAERMQRPMLGLHHEQHLCLRSVT